APTTLQEQAWNSFSWPRRGEPQDAVNTLKGIKTYPLYRVMVCDNQFKRCPDHAAGASVEQL
ncbi:hypothetical protein, partial [Arsukibacterium sp. MJ3]|uniref:hypothetical protein n=1 Tax=Arsukibacterium sp. MJ3 TaxID=1632859 RepID=UPI001F2CFC17